MSRDAEKRAQQANDAAVANQKRYGEQSDSIYKQMVPMFTQQMTNPTGFNKQDMTNLRTSSEQNTGGSVAGAVEQGNLEAARTGNSGGYATALADAARKGIAQNSQNMLNVENTNVALKDDQRQRAVAGLSNLENERLNAAMGSGSQAIGAVNAQSEASRSGWFQNMMAGINAASNAATASANLKKAYQ